SPFKFALIAFESVVGVLMGGFVLLPSALAVMGNPRTGSDELLNGQLMWIYGFSQRLPAIIQSFFFPPEIPSRPVFFPDMGAKWSSLSAWLPLFSTVGTIAYIKSRKNDFVKRIIIISMIMSLIPILNSAFVLFNNSYYARWFYMPILFLVIATVSVLETREDDLENIKSGFYWTAGIIIAFIIAIGLSPKKDGDNLTFGLYGDAVGFWCFALVALICLVLCSMLIFAFANSPSFLKITAGMLSVVILCFSLGYMIAGKSTKDRDDRYIDTILKGKEKITLSRDSFFRSDFFECDDNLGMQWDLPNIQAFHSIVPPSIMEFYPYVGIKRDVSSKPPASYDALRPLLSVKWLFIEEKNKNQEPMPEYTLKYKQNGYNIYENNNFIPMGFCYNDGILKKDAEKLSGEQKVRYMLTALTLDESTMERNKDILNIHREADFSYLSAEKYHSAIADKKLNSAYAFKTDNLGFTAKIKSQKESLMFFSVPYSRGFTATVNGIPTAIEKANIGFMAVRIPKGEVEVRFNYMTPGLKLGLNISAVAIIILICYLLFCIKFETAQSGRKIPPRAAVKPYFNELENNENNLSGSAPLENGVEEEPASDAFTKNPPKDGEEN
ncbi:MAG: YfhO family protein, partial [Oscillospiraceae bacterium]